MLDIKILYKINSYKDKDNNERKAVNFYIKCGTQLVPVEVKYFPNDDGRDFQFSGRKQVLMAFAEPLEDKT